MATNWYLYILVLWHIRWHLLTGIIYFPWILISFTMSWLFVTPTKGIRIEEWGSFECPKINLENILFFFFSSLQQKSRRVMSAKVSHRAFTMLGNLRWLPLLSFPGRYWEIEPIHLGRIAISSSGKPNHTCKGPNDMFATGKNLGNGML